MLSPVPLHAVSLTAAAAGIATQAGMGYIPDR